MKSILCLSLLGLGLAGAAHACDWRADLYHHATQMTADMKQAEDVGPGCSNGSRQICADLKARLAQDKHDMLTIIQAHEVRISEFESWTSIIDRIIGTGQYAGHGLLTTSEIAECE